MTPLPLVLHVLPIDIARGAQTYAKALRDRLDGDGALHRTVAIFSSASGTLHPDYCLAVPDGRSRARGFDPRAVKRLRALLRETDPAVVVAHGSEPLKYAVFAGVERDRLVYYRIGVGDSRLRGAHRVLHRALCARAHTIAVVSEDVAQEARQLGVDAARVRVIPNGRDSARYAGAAARSETSAARLAFVGHLSDSKRPGRFVDVVRSLLERGIDVQAVMAGDGPLRPKIADAARALPIRVLGEVADVPAVLADADIFLFPSIATGEGMPGVLIEAGLASLPIVTTNVPGASAVVEDGATGFVVGVDDFEALVGAVEELARNPNLRARMGAEGRRHCEERFGLEQSAARWRTLLDELVSRRMHVLYLIDSLIAGGAERSLAALAPQLVERDVILDVAYLYERDNVWRRDIERAGARVTSLAGGGGIAGAVRRAHRLMRELRPDIVHTTLFDADVVGRCASVGSGAVVVTSLVNEAYGREQRQNSQIRSWKLFAAQMLDAVTARRVTRFHAVSESVAVVMTRRLRLDRARVDVIARGRDAAQLGTRTVARRDGARHALGAPGGTEIVLAVGRHEFQKGFDVVLEAVAKLRVNRPELRLLIAGREGNTTAALRELVDRLAIGDIVTFLGFRDDVPDLLCAADVFVSASRWEGSPGGIIEAMALEVPIVATDIAAVQEVFGSEDLALLVPPDDADALAAALGRSINEPGSRARVAAARARFLERFTIDAAADRTVAFYERAWADRRG